MRTLPLLSILVSVLLAGCVGHPIRDNLSPPLSREHFSGQWIGHDDTGMHCYFLVLNENGRGVFGMLYRQQLARRNSVCWQMHGNDLSISLSEPSTLAPPLQVNGRSRGFDITLRVRGQGWEHLSRLLRAEQVEQEVKVMKSVAKTDFGQ